MACSACSQHNLAGARFCSECGDPLLAPNPEGERRHLTVLFCDLANSTSLAAGLDAEDWSEALVLFQAHVSRVIAECGGYVAQHLGDGLLAYFGYPVASEHDARKAARCGLALVDALRALNPQLQPICGAELSLRVGIHYGPVVVSSVGAGARKETLAIGSTANVAARVQAAAPPNTVMISDAVLTRVGHALITEDRGQYALKGIEKPVRLHSVLRARRGGRSFLGGRERLTPLVGRDAELALIQAALDDVRAGQGGSIVLLGEAGCGKSRLLHEAHERLREAGAAWIHVYADPDHPDSPLYPVLEMQRSLLELRPDEDPKHDIKRLESALEEAGFDVVESLPLLASLHGVSLAPPYVEPPLSPLGKHKQTLALLIEWVLRLAKERAVVLAVEDLHWLDPSSLELLRGLAERVHEARLLVLMSSRPSASLALPEVKRVISLGPLGTEETKRLIRAIDVSRELPESLVAAISTHCSGIPYYAEELAFVSVVAGGSAYEPAQSLPLPETLADSLAARLDQAGPAKAVIQLASVIGFEFGLDLLQTLWHGPGAELTAALSRAEQLGLLSSVERGGACVYFFRHALLRDAAYESLLRRTRRVHHHKIADALELAFPQRAKDQPELLAQHLTLAENFGKAMRYRQLAGHRALSRGAIEEALRQLNLGLQLLEKAPDSAVELEMVHTLARTLVVARGWAHPETKAAWERAARLCDPADTLRRGAIACGLGDVYSSLDLPHSLAQFEALIALGEQAEQPLLLIAGCYGAAVALYYMGRLFEARGKLDRGLALYDPARHRFFEAGFHEEKGVSLLCWSGWVHGALGSYRRGIADIERGIAVAESSGNPFALAFSLTWAASHELYARHWQEAIRRGRAGAELSSRQGFVATEALSEMVVAAAGGITREVSNGVERFVMQMGKFGDTGNRLGGPILLALLADLQLSLADPASALGTTDMGLGLARATGQPIFSAWLLALRADALVAMHHSPESVNQEAQEIESLLLQALELARAQGTHPFEVRAGMSLFRFLRQRGAPERGRRWLEEAIARFPDAESDYLDEARTLLRS